MGNKGYGSIPGSLFECITSLARALPVRSVPTFIELLIGAMLTQTGFVTGLGWRSPPCGNWSAYYKWLSFFAELSAHYRKFLYTQQR